MNIEQIKTDLSAGVIVSPATWRKLVDAALMLERFAKEIASDEPMSDDCYKLAHEVIEKVEAL